MICSEFLHSVLHGLIMSPWWESAYMKRTRFRDLPHEHTESSIVRFSSMKPENRNRSDICLFIARCTMGINSIKSQPSGSCFLIHQAANIINVTPVVRMFNQARTVIQTSHSHPIRRRAMQMVPTTLKAPSHHQSDSSHQLPPSPTAARTCPPQCYDWHLSGSPISRYPG